MGVVVYLPALLTCALVESIVEPYCYCFFFFLSFATATFSFMNSNNIHELVLFFCKRLSLMPETLVLFNNRHPLIPARLKKKKEKSSFTLNISCLLLLNSDIFSLRHSLTLSRHSRVEGVTAA